ncbi:MAG: hypothetical protein U9R48_09920 [Chloroflexota bacterium]|nr:hypothetical protein [Chloroflexota bacterium]
MPKERIRVTLGTLGPALEVVLIEAGTANGLTFAPDLLARHADLFEGVPCFADHGSLTDVGRAGGRSIRDLVGLIEDVHYDAANARLVGTLCLSQSAGWIVPLIEEFGERHRLFGLSADMWLTHDGETVTEIQSVNSVDVVVRPAAGGRFLKDPGEYAQPIPQDGSPFPSPSHHSEGKEFRMSAKQATRVQQQEGLEVAVAPPPDDEEQRESVPAEDKATTQSNSAKQLLERRLRDCALPPSVKDLVRRQFSGDPEEIDDLVESHLTAYADAVAGSSIRNLGHILHMETGLDRIELAFERLMGLPPDPKRGTPARLSGIREMYDLLTGDYDRHGVYRAERVRFANATTTTMAQITANVLNKVLLRAYERRPMWWKPVVHEEDFPNMQDVKWITLGGFDDLDTVAEGDAYTEKAWDDAYESSSFVKKGNYIGLTLEMIDRDDVQAVRALPRKLGLAANRTLSAAIAAIFTQNGGAGPVLTDGDNLFHANHNNVGTSGLSATAWDAAVQAIYKQQELNSQKRLGLRPRYCLVPIDLEKVALDIFTTDLQPGVGTNDPAIRRSSQNVITVPEWTDADDWAAVCDPLDVEGVCVGYRYGRSPELFVADNPLMGSMFTNDEMRIKVRFVYTVGVADYRGLYKANVG